jgi:hypothetical protein
VTVPRPDSAQRWALRERGIPEQNSTGSIASARHRYRLARRLFAGEDVPADARFRVVFVPIIFRGPESPLARAMLPRLPSRVRVGFLARADLPAGLSGLDVAAVRTCGPFEVEHDRNGYLGRVF